MINGTARHKIAIASVVVEKMTRFYGFSAVEPGITQEILSFIPQGTERVRLTIRQRVLNIFLNFATFGLWQWAQTIRFQNALLQEENLSKAASAIRWGASCHLEPQHISYLIHKGYKDSFCFYLNQMGKENFNNYTNASGCRYLGKGWMLLQIASEHTKRWPAEVIIRDESERIDSPYPREALAFIRQKLIGR